MKSNNKNNKPKKPFYGKSNPNTTRVAKYTTAEFKLGSSDKYDDIIDTLIAIIDSCSFDSCAICAKMRKSSFFDSSESKGMIDIGEIREFNNDTKVFSVSMPTATYDKLKDGIKADLYSIVPAIRLNKDTGEVKFISCFEVVSPEIASEAAAE